ncbi:C-type lectin domain family 12 member B-like [Dendrobates tinctorius]|uniref:C-type lectin domain family 12 member B-like n=1 Tax=Dendrobates tinctorius TaxID=92724 RepID=UPI003CCA14BD
MAEAVTYADLRFAEIPLKMMDASGDLEENDAEYGDVMYENINGPNPPKIRTKPSIQPSGPVERLRTGFQARALLLSLLLLSLLLLASSIGLAVKYIDLCHQFDHLSESHMESSRRLTEMLQKKEEDLVIAESSMEKVRMEKEALVLGVQDFNTSLLECQQTARNSVDNKETAERRLKEVLSQQEEQEKGFCPENWKLFGTKCLYFSNHEQSWEESRRECEDERSHMVVVQEDDTTLKSFIAEEKEDFWVGKELKGYYWNHEWKWPKSYDTSKKDYCWKLSNGQLYSERCWSSNKWICEKNLLLTSMKTESSYHNSKKYYSFIFSLWDVEYQCKHEKSY